MKVSPHILVVDDDPEIQRLLARYLASQGFKVSVAAGAREMRERLAVAHIDLIVLDLMLPDGSGLDLCREFRSTHPHIPIVVLTALKEEVDRIIGLEIGADDYLGKPFNPRELVARIRAVLRRSAEPQPPLVHYRFAGFTADPETRHLSTASGTEVPLTGAEFDLLRVFLDRPGRVLTRDQLLDLAHTGRADAFDRSIDVLISRIRRKLAEAGAPQLIKTVRNGGYQLAVRVESEPRLP